MLQGRGACALVIALASAGSLLVPASGESRETTPISECAAEVPSGETGVLTADLECQYRCSLDPSVTDCGEPYGDDICRDLGKGSCEPDMIHLMPGATLDLDGHSVFFAYQASAVFCDGDEARPPGRRDACTIVGPGSIVGGKGTGVFAIADVIARNLVVENTDYAIWTEGHLYLDTVSFGDREEITVGKQGIRARNVRVGPSGLHSDRDIVFDGLLVHGIGAIAGGVVRGENLVVDTYGSFEGKDVKLRRVIADAPPDWGIDPQIEIRADRFLRLIDSDIATNVESRLQSGKRPHLTRSSCDASFQLDGDTTWGVCAND